MFFNSNIKKYYLKCLTVTVNENKPQFVNFKILLFVVKTGSYIPTLKCSHLNNAVFASKIMRNPNPVILKRQ